MSSPGGWSRSSRRRRLPAPALPAPVPITPPTPTPALGQPRTDQGPLQGSGGGPGVAPGGTFEAPDASQAARPLAEPASSALSRFLVGEYDDDRGAFVLVRPRDAQRVPFELRLDLFTQARYTNFARSADSWVDSTGVPRPIRSYESVEITRNFIQFSGFAIDPRLQFTAFLFSSTALNDTVYLGWINYRFSDAFDLRVGNWIVPGTREWFESFRYTQGADRLMATTFFRPNISPGIWAQGEPIKGLNYVAMFANSLNRFSQGVERVGSAADLRRDSLVDARRRFRSRAVRRRESPGARHADRHQPGRLERAEPGLQSERGPGESRGHDPAAFGRYAAVPPGRA